MNGMGADVLNEVDYGTYQFDQTLALRDEVLRKPLGIEFTPEERALDERSFHLACWRGQALAGCLVLTPLSAKRIQMRQLAVRGDLQRQGIGRNLVVYSEDFARDRGCEEMILHAREGAVAFYQKLGYEVRGDRFIEVTIPHVTMRKALLNRGAPPR